MPFEFTKKQDEAWDTLCGPALHALLYGGSRSGKTLLICRNIAIRARAAPFSRHAILRFRFNHVKASIILDTWPKMMELCFPKEPYHMDKSDWYCTLGEGSQVWFGGLDEKERTEKILGQEYATVFLNEASQIPYSSQQIALTRLAQKVACKDGEALRLRMFYDENPPSKGHWTYKLFFAHTDPETKQPLRDRQNYAACQMNPVDNKAHLPADYLKTLESMPARMRKRFLLGEFSEDRPNALWTEDVIERWRVIDGQVPDYQRIVIGVDPSGASEETSDSDEIGIVVGALGTDGNGYVLEDLTLKAGPSKWGKAATNAFERHAADMVVGEVNYGGAMVEHVIRTARPRTPYKAVHASRGKVVRAEPIASLYEQGKVRHVGYFPELEDELCGFTTFGYTGERSPNRADAAIWVFSELFPGLTIEPKEPKKGRRRERPATEAGWMGA